jgi:hypothetical protein
MQPTINGEEEIVLTSISDDNRENKNDAHFAQHGAKKMDLRPAEQLPALYMHTAAMQHDEKILDSTGANHNWVNRRR